MPPVRWSRACTRRCCATRAAATRFCSSAMPGTRGRGRDGRGARPGQAHPDARGCRRRAGRRPTRRWPMRRRPRSAWTTSRRIVERLRQRFPRMVGPEAGDVCYATQNRQEAVARAGRAARAPTWCWCSARRTRRTRIGCAKWPRRPARAAYLLGTRRRAGPGLAGRRAAGGRQRGRVDARAPGRRRWSSACGSWAPTDVRRSRRASRTSSSRRRRCVARQTERQRRLYGPMTDKTGAIRTRDGGDADDLAVSDLPLRSGRHGAAAQVPAVRRLARQVRRGGR